MSGDFPFVAGVLEYWSIGVLEIWRFGDLEKESFNYVEFRGTKPSFNWFLRWNNTNWTFQPCRHVWTCVRDIVFSCAINVDPIVWVWDTMDRRFELLLSLLFSNLYFVMLFICLNDVYYICI